jgi:hypothetical protein
MPERGLSVLGLSEPDSSASVLFREQVPAERRSSPTTRRPLQLHGSTTARAALYRGSRPRPCWATRPAHPVGSLGRGLPDVPRARRWPSRTADRGLRRRGVEIDLRTSITEEVGLTVRPTGGQIVSAPSLTWSVGTLTRYVGGRPGSGNRMDRSLHSRSTSADSRGGAAELRPIAVTPFGGTSVRPGSAADVVSRPFNYRPPLPPTLAKPSRSGQGHLPPCDRSGQPRSAGSVSPRGILPERRNNASTTPARVDTPATRNTLL